eukprot:scaffold345_cov134-Cylindrotheca_fusiformis.AAC.69
MGDGWSAERKFTAVRDRTYDLVRKVSEPSNIFDGRESTTDWWMGSVATKFNSTICQVALNAGTSRLLPPATGRGAEKRTLCTLDIRHTDHLQAGNGFIFVHRARRLRKIVRFSGSHSTSSKSATV